jgi:hypothetical protein
VGEFGRRHHYGRFFYQHEELVYQSRANARTQSRVQLEDGEEYDMNYDQIMRGNYLLNATDSERLIVIPFDRGESKRPGAIPGRGNRGEEEEEEEVYDSDLETDNNDTDGDLNVSSDALEDDTGNVEIQIDDGVDGLNKLDYPRGLLRLAALSRSSRTLSGCCVTRKEVVPTVV